MRVTDAMVEHWLAWARNFGEVVAWRNGRLHGERGERRRFRVRVTPGVTCNGSPFRPKAGILDITGHAENDVVPSELMLTAREALIFGYGCAVGRAGALLEDEQGWQADRRAEWTPELREAFATIREQAREENRAQLDREAEEHERARQTRMAQYRARRDGVKLLGPGKA